MMHKNNSGKAQHDFWGVLGVTVIFSLVIVGLVVWLYMEIGGVNNKEDAVVGLITLFFTLPITFAASYVVIKLGDRMDKLANEASERDEKFSKISHELAVQAEVRESFLLAKQMYDEMFGQLSELAKSFNSSMDGVYWLLDEMQAERFSYSRMSEEEQEDIKEGRRKNDIGFDSNGNVGGAEYTKSDEHYAEKLILESARIRENISKAVSVFIQNCWSVKHEKVPHYFLDALINYKTKLENDLPALEVLLESNPGMNESKLKAVYEKLRSNNSDDIKFYDRLCSSINDISCIYDNPLVAALVQINTASRFCRDTSPDKQVVRQLMKDLLNGEASFQESSDLLLGLIIFPLPMIKLEKEEQEDIDSEGVSWFGSGNQENEIRENIAHEINRLGLLSIYDLRDVWPTKVDLISHIIGMVVPEASAKSEIQAEINKRMEALPDPRKLVATFMSGGIQRHTTLESIS